MSPFDETCAASELELSHHGVNDVYSDLLLDHKASCFVLYKPGYLAEPRYVALTSRNVCHTYAHLYGQDVVRTEAPDVVSMMNHHL